MNTAETADIVYKALERHADDNGIEIVSVEISGPKTCPNIRVRIDTLAGIPVSLDEISAQTPWISKVLDELDPFESSYNLEVSSPGLDRPLTKLKDYERFQGSRVVITVREGERKNYTGILGAQNGSVVSVICENKVCLLDFENIKSCKLKPDYSQLFNKQ